MAILISVGSGSQSLNYSRKKEVSPLNIASGVLGNAITFIAAIFKSTVDPAFSHMLPPLPRSAPTPELTFLIWKPIVPPSLGNLSSCG